MIQTNGDDPIHADDLDLIVNPRPSTGIVQTRQDRQVTQDARVLAVVLRDHLDDAHRRALLATVVYDPAEMRCGGHRELPCATAQPSDAVDRVRGEHARCLLGVACAEFFCGFVVCGAGVRVETVGVHLLWGGLPFGRVVDALEMGLFAAFAFGL